MYICIYIYIYAMFPKRIMFRNIANNYFKLFIHTEMALNLIRTCKTDICFTNHTNNTTLHFWIHNFQKMLDIFHILRKSIYLREPQGNNKNVEDNYVLSRITFLIPSNIWYYWFIDLLFSFFIALPTIILFNYYNIYLLKPG